MGETNLKHKILAIAEDPAIGREIAAVSASGESADDLDALCDLLALHPGTAAAPLGNAAGAAFNRTCAWSFHFAGAAGSAWNGSRRN